MTLQLGGMDARRCGRRRRMELAGALAAQGTQQWDGIMRAPPFARGTAASAAPRRGRRRGMIHSDRGQHGAQGRGQGMTRHAVGMVALHGGKAAWGRRMVWLTATSEASRGSWTFLSFVV
jgi:hypothetical protein